MHSNKEERLSKQTPLFIVTPSEANIYISRCAAPHQQNKKSCLFPFPSKGGETDSFYFIQIFRNLLDDLLSSNNHGESLSRRMEAAATHVIDNV